MILKKQIKNTSKEKKCYFATLVAEKNDEIVQNYKKNKNDFIVKTL